MPVLLFRKQNLTKYTDRYAGGQQQNYASDVHGFFYKDLR
jgi:hypothetical protein